MLFDPSIIADRSEVAHPNALATGVVRVWVNGVVVFEKGAATGAGPGRAARRSGL
ncbi:hypothetical protein BH10PSE4_BH10PSE4_18940 [soil metagenome]